MKCFYVFPLTIAVLFFGGCEPKKKQAKPVMKKKKELVHEKVAKVDIPVAGDAVRSFFEEDIGEFAVLDDLKTGAPERGENSAVAFNDSVIPREYEEEFAWVEEEGADKDLDIVYYEFDSYDIQDDQEDKIENNVNRLLGEVEIARQEGKEPVIVIEGHSCSITRSRIYNFALSEQRAKRLADRLVEAGIPRDNLKVVGRGEEYPAIVDGKPVMGTKDEQGPNRRAEIHVIYA